MKNRRCLIAFFVLISTLGVQAVNISDCSIVRRNPWDGKVAVTYYVPEGGSDEKVSIDVRSSTGHHVSEYYETGYMLPPEPWRPEPAATLNGFYGGTEFSGVAQSGAWLVIGNYIEFYVDVLGPCKVCWKAPNFVWEREFGSDAYPEDNNGDQWLVLPSAKVYRVMFSCHNGGGDAYDFFFKQMIRFGSGNSYLSAGWHTILIDDLGDGDDVEVSMSVGGVTVKTERIEQTKNNVVYHQKGKPLQVYLDPTPFEGVGWPSIFDGSQWRPMELPSSSYSPRWTGDSWESGEEKSSEAFLLVNKRIVASSKHPTIYTWTPPSNGTNFLELVFVEDKKVVAPSLMAAVIVQSVDLRIEPRNEFGPGTYLQMTASDPAATIYYTLDGTDPTQGSPVFVPFELPETELTVKAIAVLPNGIVSDVVTQRLVPRRSALPTVRYSRGYTAQGGYDYRENVDIANLTSAIRVHLSASDHYTVDGTEPVESSPDGSQPFWIEKDTTLKVKSFSRSAYPSETLTLDFKFPTKPVVVQVKNPTIRYYAGLIHMNCPTDGAEIHYEVKTYNTIPTIDSPCYEEPLNVDSVSIVSAVAFPGLSSCNTKSGCSVFTVNPQVKNENDVVELPNCELWSSQTADMRTDSGWRPDWSVDCDEFHSGQSSLHSSGGTLDMVIPEDGTLTFWWKYTTSNSVGLEFDGVQFYDGIYDTEHSNWMKVRVVVEGNHIAVDDITGAKDKGLYSGTIRGALDLRNDSHVMRWRTNNQMWIDDLHWQSSCVSPVTVVYHANGGDGGAFTNTTEGIIEENQFSRLGYTFSGWAVIPEGEKVYDPGDQIEESVMTDEINLYAVWLPISYTVSFDANKGSGLMVDLACVYGVAYELPACGYVREGYVFAGWATAASGDVAFRPGDSIENLASNEGDDVVLYANWIKVIAKVVFDANGGSGGAVYQIGVGQKIPEVPQPKRDGYDFLGWFTLPDGGALLRASDIIVDDVQYYAHWKMNLKGALNVATVAFQSGGSAAAWFGQTSLSHDGEGAAQSGMIGHNQTCWMKAEIDGPCIVSFWWKVSSENVMYDYLEFLVDDLRQARIGGETEWAQYTSVIGEGKHTIKWNYQKDGSQSKGMDCGWVDQLELTTPCTITLDAQGGDAVPSVVYRKQGDVCGDLPIATRRGYTFKGWYTTGNYQERMKTDSIVAGDMRLYALWMANRYTVAFDLNGGVGSIQSVVCNYDYSLLTLPKSAGVRMGYVFKGWSLSATGKVIYQPGEMTSDNLTDVNNGVVWLYAIWEQEIIPELSETADVKQVKSALSGSVDLALAENITDAAIYNAYREWALKIGASDVKASPFAWASFATDSAALLAKMPTDEDLKVEEFKPSPTAGSFDFTVSVKDVKIGDKASVDNLKKLFGLEGAESLDTAAFSSENVSLDFRDPQDGKLKFTATPAVDNAKSFFMKVKVK